MSPRSWASLWGALRVNLDIGPQRRGHHAALPYQRVHAAILQQLGGNFPAISARGPKTPPEHRQSRDTWRLYAPWIVRQPLIAPRYFIGAWADRPFRREFWPPILNRGEILTPRPASYWLFARGANPSQLTA